MKRALLGSLVFTTVWGCASANLEVRARRSTEGAIRYEGALAGPHATFERLVEKTCSRLTASHASASSEDTRPSGYCAGYFYSPEDRAFFISTVSAMAGTQEGEQRSCALPRNLLDPVNTREVVSLGGSRSLAPERPASPWQPTSFLNQTTQEPHDRDLLVFNLEESGTCVVYGYDHFRRLITSQRDDRFVIIGRVNRDGAISQAALHP
jgi:hypothetical protein